MAGVKGWYSAIGWNQPGIASAGTKAVEMSGRRISGMALLPAASAFGLAIPIPTAIQVSARANSVSAMVPSTIDPCRRPRMSKAGATSHTTAVRTASSAADPLARAAGEARISSFASVAAWRNQDC